MSSKLSHEISKYGRLDVAIHGKAEFFYNELESLGLIDYLKGLDHLGFISKSHPGNNHKRWDYVILQLYLLHKLKHNVFKNGLSSSHRITEGYEISGLEILQVAVLFSNIGHLPGTLASEKSLFKNLQRYPQRKSDFLSFVNQDSRWQDYVDKVFEDYDYYKVKYLCALNLVYKNFNDQQLKDILHLFFSKSIEEDNRSLGKLKWVFLRVRQLSFIYLDSYNSDFSFHIDITRILLNPFNYKSLFNVNSKDYEDYFDSIETTLSKKLYISEKSSQDLIHNEKKFEEYLDKEFKRTGSNKLDYKNLVISLFDRSVRKFQVERSDNNHCYQFYISKEDTNIFGTTFTFFDWKSAQNNLYTKEDELTTSLNKSLSSKDHRVCLIHDQRKKLLFNNLVVKRESIGESDFLQFLLNYVNVHKDVLKEYKPSDSLAATLRPIAYSNLSVHYCRKVMSHLLKLCFKQQTDEELSIYIKFDKLNETEKLLEHGLRPTGYLKGISSIRTFQSELNSANSDMPLEIKNNHKIIDFLISNKIGIKRNINLFYSILPMEVDLYKSNIAQLHTNQNPETVDTLTDIDAVLIAFNKSQIELYLIEGKNTTGFQSAVQDDFDNKIKPIFRFPSLFPAHEIVNSTGAKGGFVKFEFSS